MDDLKASNKSTWLFMLLLSSPVIVQLIKIGKEAILGSKNEHERTTAMLEVALAELIAQRKQQEMQPNQKVVYVPVSQQGIPLVYHQPYQAVGSIDPRMMMARMQQQVRDQMERLALMHAQRQSVEPIVVAQLKPQINVDAKQLPDIKQPEEVFQIKG